MNHLAVAKDNLGVRRCYGVGETIELAIENCKEEALQYLEHRRDIDRLDIYIGENKKRAVGLLFL